MEEQRMESPDLGTPAAPHRRWRRGGVCRPSAGVGKEEGCIGAGEEEGGISAGEKEGGVGADEEEDDNDGENEEGMLRMGGGD
jgi:hypothetical protein